MAEQRRGQSPSRNAAGAAASTQQQVPFEDSPFLYYPRLATDIPAEAAPKLIADHLAARHEYEDLTEIRLPILDVEVDKEMATAPLSRHLVSVNSQMGRENEVVPASMRLIHLAVAKNQRQLVTRFIASHGNVNLRTSPISCMNELGPRGVTGLHDASIALVVVALWMKRHEILEELFEAGADPIFGGVVQLPNGDKLPPFMRRLTDIDRADFPPTQVGRRRSVLSYALRVADLKGMEIFLKHCKSQGFLLKVTQAEIDAARAVRSDPAIVARVEEAAKQGYLKICDNADDDLHPKTGEEDAESPLRKNLAFSLKMARLSLLGIVIVLLVWIGIIVVQANDKLGQRMAAGIKVTALDRLYQNHLAAWIVAVKGYLGL